MTKAIDFLPVQDLKPQSHDLVVLNLAILAFPGLFWNHGFPKQTLTVDVFKLFIELKYHDIVKSFVFF